MTRFDQPIQSLAAKCYRDFPTSRVFMERRSKFIIGSASIAREMHTDALVYGAQSLMRNSQLEPRTLGYDEECVGAASCSLRPDHTPSRNRTDAELAAVLQTVELSRVRCFRQTPEVFLNALRIRAINRLQNVNSAQNKKGSGPRIDVRAELSLTRRFGTLGPDDARLDEFQLPTI
jgi:hypothetical protein